MNTLARLSGQVTLRPGAALPTIRNTRPEIAARLAPGRRADEWPELLGTVLTLCAQAHRHTARQAVEAARRQPAATPAGMTASATSPLVPRRALQIATARDQILRITHDWPLQLPAVGRHTAEPDQAVTPTDAAAQAALLLRACPLWRRDLDPADQLAELPSWLEHRWLGMAPAEWLGHYEADPGGWPALWAHDGSRRASPVQRLLREQLDGAAATLRRPLPATPLQPLDDPSTHLPRLAQQMASQPGFCAEPDWHGVLADTGPWTRHTDPLRRAGWQAGNAWDRLVSRVVDVLRLAAPAGADWLAQGALGLGAGPLQGGPSALAWSEMARGLLLHWVELSPDGQQLVGARVLAPTEWNFHPHGVLARALLDLPPEPEQHHPASAARRLAVAFDPCVEITIEEHADA